MNRTNRSYSTSRPRSTSFPGSSNSISSYSSLRSANTKNNFRAQNPNGSRKQKFTQQQDTFSVQTRTNSRYLRCGEKTPPEPAPPPAPKPVPDNPAPPAPPEPSSWGKSIMDRIDKELDGAFGAVDDGMAQCFGAIDKAKHKYIEVNRKFLDFLEKL